MRLCRPLPSITVKEPLCQIMLNSPSSSTSLSLVAVVPHWAALVPLPLRDNGLVSPPATASPAGAPRGRTLHLPGGNADDGGAPTAP